MTARERRIAELAAQDLDSWARELPLGSETRRDLQQTARAYRFVARAGGPAGTLRAVPDAEVEKELPPAVSEVTSWAGDARAPGEPALLEVPRPLDPPLDRGA